MTIIHASSILQVQSPSGVHGQSQDWSYIYRGITKRMYYKDFDKWNEIKKEINDVETEISIRAGEVRWVSFGVNIGSEIDGKGDSFNLPALVVSVFGSRLALVVPLTSKSKSIPGYMPFEWKGKTDMLCVNQVRIVSQKRIFSRLAHISDKHLKKCKEEIKRFFAL